MGLNGANLADPHQRQLRAEAAPPLIPLASLLLEDDDLVRLSRQPPANVCVCLVPLLPNAMCASLRVLLHRELNEGARN